MLKKYELRDTIVQFLQANAGQSFSAKEIAAGIGKPLSYVSGMMTKLRIYPNKIWLTGESVIHIFCTFGASKTAPHRVQLYRVEKEEEQPTRE